MRILEMFTPFHSYLPSNNAFFLLLTWGVAETVNSGGLFQTKSCSDHRLTSPTYTMHFTVFCTVACICLRFAVFSTAVHSALFIALRTALRCKCGDRDCTPCTSPPFEYRPALKLREISLLAWKINQTIWLFFYNIERKNQSLALEKHLFLHFHCFTRFCC